MGATRAIHLWQYTLLCNNSEKVCHFLLCSVICFTVLKSCSWQQYFSSFGWRCALFCMALMQAGNLPEGDTNKYGGERDVLNKRRTWTSWDRTRSSYLKEGLHLSHECGLGIKIMQLTSHHNNNTNLYHLCKNVRKPCKSLVIRATKVQLSVQNKPQTQNLQEAFAHILCLYNQWESTFYLLSITWNIKRSRPFCVVILYKRFIYWIHRKCTVSWYVLFKYDIFSEQSPNWKHEVRPCRK